MEHQPRLRDRLRRVRRGHSLTSSIQHQQAAIPQVHAGRPLEDILVTDPKLRAYNIDSASNIFPVLRIRRERRLPRRACPVVNNNIRTHPIPKRWTLHVRGSGASKKASTARQAPRVPSASQFPRSRRRKWQPVVELFQSCCSGHHFGKEQPCLARCSLISDRPVPVPCI